MVVMRVSVSLNMSPQTYNAHDDDDGGGDVDFLPAPSERKGPPLQGQREDCSASIQPHCVVASALLVLRSPSREGDSGYESNNRHPTSLTTSSWRVGPVPTPTTLSPANSSFGSRSLPIMVFHDSIQPNLLTSHPPPASEQSVSLLEREVPAPPSSLAHLATTWKKP